MYPPDDRKLRRAASKGAIKDWLNFRKNITAYSKACGSPGDRFKRISYNVFEEEEEEIEMEIKWPLFVAFVLCEQ
ncbi:uncharacterized protein EAE97_004098 [Botrytis byssoidea]|uniref:Uncharacterized protein n=1 Tax=Botrytis byssoidea TaxID=139641 RepID=A0A9P5M7F8_9HELO|nr:uncharacterized protein EAE97_004098 [Botrytis byssoidea]KAF7946849.1 hypothetical protein EAE97_004098 [Botrytis byssoidea]